MNRSKQHFLDFLAGRQTVPVLFEPFFSRTHAETLIWRRAEHLWNTPQAQLDTLTYLTERTQADVVFTDLRPLSASEKEAMLRAVSAIAADNLIGYGLICDSADVPLCEQTDGVTCLCVYGEAVSAKIPVIRMDGTAEEAVQRGDTAWFCRDHAEEYLERYGSRLRILGGLGLDTLINGSPVAIYDRVERIVSRFPGQWACGSGGVIPDANYLELISLLGAFARIR